MEMTHAQNKVGSKKERKRLFRKLKTLTKNVLRHGERYRTLLAERWQETDLSQGETNEILRRLDNIIDQTPQVIRQAHERIIGERQVPNKNKIFSLYEPHACIYKRGKAGARVEFGLQLLIAENSDGVIIDWDLIDGQPQHDTKLLVPCLQRIQESIGIMRPQVVVGDRGFASKANEEILKEKGITDALCPRSPHELKDRLGEEQFARHQKRRAQTEARIGIIKNNFIGSRMPAKGKINQERHVAWCILAHNLWVIARMIQEPEIAVAAA